MNELLTPGEMTYIKDCFPCAMWIKETAQAQLNKVLNPPELDKPDGEGWWWIIYMGQILGTRFIKEEDFAHIYTSEYVKWQRVLVPE